jgi:hypothetical protein
VLDEVLEKTDHGKKATLDCHSMNALAVEVNTFIGRITVFCRRRAGRRLQWIWSAPFSRVRTIATAGLAMVYREHKCLANVIYTLELHAPRTNENDDIRLFHQFVSGFRVK